MALKYILDTVAEKLGFDVETQRELLLKKINRASKEVYESQDLPGCLRELVLEVPPDSVIACPYFVGDLKAMREYATKVKVELKEMGSKYSYNSWPEIWRNWRVMKKSPIRTSIRNASFPIRFSMNQPESEDVTIIITGATQYSARVTEELTFIAGSTEVQATNLYTEIHSITKNSPNIQNITATGLDEDGNDLVLAVIPNDRLVSTYTLIDVSMLPQSGDVNGGTARYIEVLYKEPLFQFVNDGDEFICEGFDDAIVYKTCELEYADKDGGGEKSIGFYQKCQQVIFNRVNSTNGTTQKEIIFAPNQYFELFPKYTPYYRTRYFGVSR